MPLLFVGNCNFDLFRGEPAAGKHPRWSIFSVANIQTVSAHGTIYIWFQLVVENSKVIKAGAPNRKDHRLII